MQQQNTQEERKQMRAKEFKRGIDADEARARRGDSALQLRKNKREENLRKRRSRAPVGGIRIQGVQTKVSLKDAQQWIKKLYSEDPAQVLESTVHFRKLLSLEKSPPIRSVIEMGVVSRFVQLLMIQTHPDVQYEAAWCLTNLSSGSHEETMAVVDAGAVPILISLMQSPVEKVREQAIWALGNVSGDCAALRDMCLKSGIMQPLLFNVRNSEKLSLVRNAAWTLSNCCRAKPKPDFNLIRDCVPVLAVLINHQDKEVLTDACWALSYLSDGESDRIQAVVNGNCLSRLVQLLTHSQASIQTPALRTVGNVVTGNDVQTQAVLDCQGLMPALLSLLTSPRKVVRKEATWTVSNIMAGKPGQIDVVLRAQMVPILLRHLGGSEAEVRKEAAWAIGNALSSGRQDQIGQLIEAGAIKPICDILANRHVSLPLLKVMLHGLEVVLKCGELKVRATGKYGAVNPCVLAVEDCGGLDFIEALQNHEDEEIYLKAVQLIETYFGDDDDAEENGLEGLAPANMAAAPFAFGQPTFDAGNNTGFGGGNMGGFGSSSGNQFSF